jgi:putative ABC transport system permease protein
MKLLRYNLKSLGSRATTAITAAIGVALVTMVLSGALMLAEGVRSTLLAEGDPNTAVVIRKGSDAELASGFETSATAIVFDSPGVRSNEGRPLATAEVVVVAALARIGTDGIGNVTLRGIDGSSIAMRDVRVIEGRAPAFGTDEAMVGARIAGRFERLAIGESIELRHNRPLRIVGVFESSGGSTESEVWLDRALLEDAFGRTGVVSSARVALEPARSTPSRSASSPIGVSASRSSASRTTSRSRARVSRSSSRRWASRSRSSSRSPRCSGPR